MEKLCKKCLLKDIDKDEYYKNIYDYIESIPEYLKASSITYNKRLMICKNCDSLVNGMCKICGCFVEVRASINNNYCPNINKYW